VYSLVVAEDEELFRKELCGAQNWEDWGFLLSGAASDGREALELVRLRRPDALVTDIRMPGLDGLGLVEALRSEFPEDERPLVLIISGHSEFEYARRAVRLGAFDFLLKPLDDAELEAAMRRMSAALAARTRRRAVEGAPDAALAFFAEYAPEASRDPADAYVERAVTEIRDGYVTDLSVESVASRVGISGGHLARLFKTRTGRTFSEYLALYRMKRAAELLRDPTIRIGEVADLVGYADQRHFSTLFRRLVGTTPTEFREGRFGHPQSSAPRAETPPPFRGADSASRR
jgi:two-component system response regulator YesN